MPTYSKMVMPGGGPRSSRIMRLMRAVWRDTSALLREFRVSILVFLIVTLFGGWVYGELDYRAKQQRYRDYLAELAVYNTNPRVNERPEQVPRAERIPYVDLPYIMVALMILETPIDLPAEPYLIVFWYAMPLIAIYIIGRGAADFVRLFFNRGERRDAWEEAVASTYRNHIIILGAGHVGMGVARELARMGFEVIAIEQNLSAERDAELSELGVPCIVGDGRTDVTLHKAGIMQALAFAACTSDDYVNLETVMRVRDLNPNIRIVTRMWDDNFKHQLQHYYQTSAVMSASDLAAPVFAGAAVGIEITQSLQINRQAYSMIRVSVTPGSFLDGSTVEQLENEHNSDIVLHGRDTQIDVQPRNSTLVQAGDTLVIFSHQNRINEIVARNTNPLTPAPIIENNGGTAYRDHVVVMGIGHVGIRITRLLVAMGFKVVAIDAGTDSDKRGELHRLGVPCIVADGRKASTLKEACITAAQSFVICTSNDYINLEAAMRARDLAPELPITARIWDSHFAHQLRTHFNVRHVFNSAELAAPAFAGAVVGIEITRSLQLRGREYSMIQLKVEEGSFMSGRMVGELQKMHDIDVVLHARDGEVQVHPARSNEVQTGDMLVIFSDHDQITQIVRENHRGPRSRYSRRRLITHFSS